MAQENPTWGQERIANELLLKLGLQVSPRTVRNTWLRPEVVTASTEPHHNAGQLSYAIMPQAYWACDFCVTITAMFRILYVFVVIEHASRRLIHVNVTSHPTAQWTLQQFWRSYPSRSPVPHLDP